MNIKHLNRLHSEVSAVCPIHGLSSDAIDFANEATEQQKTQAIQVVAQFDDSDTTHQQWLENQNLERRDLRQASAQAISDIDAYLAIVSPSNVQVVAQVRRLSQYTKAIIKRLIQIN